jgi:tetratricopeptide (TPR) repeat protein
MRIKTFLYLPALSFFGAAFGQTDNPPMTNVPTAPKPHIVPVEQPVQPSAPPAPAPAPKGTTATGEAMDPAKVAEYQARFLEGYQLQQAGKLGDARTIYDGILAEQPQAKRSLLEAGRCSLLLGQYTKADDYLSKLHAIVPDFPEAIELLIQTNQALKHDVKVELLLRDFRTLHDSGKIPELTKSLCFVRERIADDKQVIAISQFFDYNQTPNTVYMAEVFDLYGNLQRRILLNYDDDTTKALRAKDAKFATTEVFTWFEHKMTAGKVTEIDAYLQVFALPDYNKFRSAMFVILANPPKPIYSAPVGAAAAQ